MKWKRLLAVLLCLCMMVPLFPWGLAASEEKSVEAMVQRMTLEEKLGQMLMPAFRTWSGKPVTELNDAIRDAIQTYGFGGIILFSENTGGGTESTTRLICEMQQAALSSSAGLPLLMGVDQEGGSVVRLGTGTSLCGNMALTATGKPSLAKTAAAILGRELAAEGFQLDFAPDMDVNSNPENPVIGLRSFSDDPEEAALYGSAFLAGLHSANVAGALKHFPGHGDTVTDSHSGLPRIDKTLKELFASDLIPFQTGIQKGADVIMTAHIQYPQIETETYLSKADNTPITLPATLSKTIVSGLLRGMLGFQGVVCTDAMNMEAIAQHFDRMDAARYAINAGVDILLMPVDLTGPEGLADLKSYLEGLVGMVEDGSIQERTIDAAVTRILTLKQKQGLLDNFSVSEEAQVEKALSTVGSKENHDAEWEVTTKAVTLVKNDGQTLPYRLSDGDTALLFCPFDDETASMNYGLYQLRAKGILSFGVDCQTVSYNKQTSAAPYQSALTGADAIVAVVETAGQTGMNPAAEKGWQAAFLDDLIDRAHALGKKVCIVSARLPYDLARYQDADALLAVYGYKGMSTAPTTYDGETPTYGPNLPAAVYSVFGGCSPTGTLPVNIPALDGQYRYTDTILYPNGYGYAGWLVSDSFVDVPLNTYYTEPVAWAVSEGITTGVSEKLFAPEDNCSRAQVVTFLWRAAGCPNASGSIAFTDVPDKAYYAEAVRWAVSEGITTGANETLFAPYSPCTRAQIVTFLARFAGVKEKKVNSGFVDVPRDAYYASAVKWAAEKGITTGTERNQFSPKENCSRGQVVTFLSRYING